MASSLLRKHEVQIQGEILTQWTRQKKKKGTPDTLFWPVCSCIQPSTNTHLHIHSEMKIVRKQSLHLTCINTLVSLLKYSNDMYIQNFKAREMAPWLGVLPALAEDPGQVLSTHRTTHPIYLQFYGIQVSLSVPVGSSIHMVHVHTLIPPYSY